MISYGRIGEGFGMGQLTTESSKLAYNSHAYLISDNYGNREKGHRASTIQETNNQKLEVHIQ